MAEGDVSQLDKMAAGLMERKEAAAARAKLTPVKGERATAESMANVIPDIEGHPEAFMAQESILAAVREVRRQAEAMLAQCDAVEKALGQPERPVLTIVPDVKVAEKAADAKAAARAAAAPLTADTTAEEFTAKQAAQMAAAQAAAFKAPDSTVEGGEDPDSAEAIAAAAAEDAASESPLAALGAAILEEDKVSAGVLAAAAGLWVCPDHGTRQDTKSRKGRAMVACGSYPALCQKFEMPA